MMIDELEQPKGLEGEAGIEPISQAMTRMRILVGRRYVSRLAMQKMEMALELTHTDVIKTVSWLGRSGEVTVGAVAEAMRIDPSRGSRLVADLVEKGMLRRSVSQKDARRAVIELTDAAKAYFEKSDQAKVELIQEITRDWSEDDINRFGELFLRFVVGFESAADAGEASKAAAFGAAKKISER